MYFVKGPNYTYTNSSLLKAVFTKVTLFGDLPEYVVYKGDNKVGIDVLLSAVETIFKTLDLALDSFTQVFDLLSTLEEVDTRTRDEFINEFMESRNKLVKYKEKLLLESIGF